MEQILALIEAEQFACALKNIENENGMNERTFKVISEKRNLATSMLVSSDARPDPVFTSNNQRIFMMKTLKKMKVILIIKTRQTKDTIYN